MEEILLPAFEKLKQTGARHIHYKTCSTFDSSPAVGSIGKAIDIGSHVFNNTFIPLLVAAPVLGRYCLFGNLFARMGIGSRGEIYRLDRHPSMSKHPVTPSDESDLRLHLGKQTNKKTGLLDILQLSKPYKVIQQQMQKLFEEGSDIILIDALYQEQLLLIGELIDGLARDGSLFSVGSSGIEMALGQYWNANKKLEPVNEWPDHGKIAPLLVISGSCSPVTAAQIECALSNDFEELVIDTTALINAGESFIQAQVERAILLLKNNKSLIIHSNGTKRLQQDISVPAEKLGTVLGNIAREITARINIKRIIVAGGDTSSYAARAMGIESVQMIGALVPGAPLCVAKAPGSPIDGIQVNFKGGQVGGKAYFLIIRDGRMNEQDKNNL